MLNTTVNEKTQIKLCSNVSEMTGIGEEWLLNASGNPHAIFINGNLQCQVFAIGAKKETVTPILEIERYRDECPF